MWRAAQCLSRTVNAAAGEERQPAWRIAVQEFYRVRQAFWFLRKLQRRREPGAGETGMVPERYIRPDLLAPPEPVFDVPGERGLSLLQRDLYDAFHRRILPNNLRVFDRATMASAIESRAPFLDFRVVRYVFSLPISDIVGGGETKHILREAMRPLLPAAVVNRRAKLGFAVTLPKWFNSPAVRDYLASMIHDPAFAEHGMIDGKVFAEDFDRCARRGFSWQDTVRVWEVVNLSLWWRIFVKGIPRATPR
jgi:hypothetical protein